MSLARAYSVSQRESYQGKTSLVSGRLRMAPIGTDARRDATALARAGAAVC